MNEKANFNYVQMNKNLGCLEKQFELYHIMRVFECRSMTQLCISENLFLVFYGQLIGKVDGPDESQEENRETRFKKPEMQIQDI